MEKVKIFAYVTLLLFLYFVSYYLFVGFKNPVPEPGDSFDYHIPISQSILNGSFINLPHPKLPHWYYPGSSEAINSIFIFLKIPLTLSNLFAILILAFVCFKLGLRFGLNKYYSLLFATTICSLTAVTRWFNAVSVDVWFASFFLIAVILLEKPKKKISYFITLGFIFGMIIGTKYTALLYLIPIVIIYFKKLWSYISLPRVIAFLIPFSLLGLFWYVRNYILTGNPFYPTCILTLPCWQLFNGSVWNITLTHPIEMINAIFGEYKLWSLGIITAPILYFAKNKFKINNRKRVTRLLFLGVSSLLILLLMPSSAQPWIMVSSFRYSYIAFILLILIVFLYASKFQKEEWLGYFIIANALPVLSLFFYPKLILFYFPAFLVFVYLFEKYNPKQIKV